MSENSDSRKAIRNSGDNRVSQRQKRDNLKVGRNRDNARLKERAVKPVVNKAKKVIQKKLAKDLPVPEVDLPKIPTSLKEVNEKLKEARPKFQGIGQLRKDLKGKRKVLKEDMRNDGVKSALDKHAFGLGTVLQVGLASTFTPATAAMVFRVADVVAKTPMLSFILWTVSLLILCGVAIMVLYLFAIMLLIVLFIAVMIILFVPDDNVDVSGIDTSGINIDGVVATSSGGSSDGTASSGKAGSGGMATPEALRGKFIFVNADQTSVACGRWLCPRENTPYHYGVDYNMTGWRDGGFPQYPIAEGRVLEAGGYGYKSCDYKSGKSYGMKVTIIHDDIIDPSTGKAFVSRYAHLENNSIKVQKGDKVYLDTLLGTMGKTGCSTGVHLHFELMNLGESDLRQSKGVNPELYMMCNETQTVKEVYPKGWGDKKKCYEYQKKVRGI